MNFYFWKMMGVGKGIVSGNKNFVNLLSHHRFYSHKYYITFDTFYENEQFQCELTWNTI